MLKNKKIFIVEDDMLNRVVYTVILIKEGVQIEFDRLGRNTTSKLKEKQYDLIILDLMLPHGDSGFIIYKEIRQLPAYANTPIVAISAGEPAIAIPKTQELGFDGFIAKPLNKHLFPQQLIELLQGQKIWYAGERF